jgi:hypothetical protein
MVMQEIRTVYTTALDALLAVTKRLSLLEARHSMSSEMFCGRYSKGEMGDDEEVIDWANDYQNCLVFRRDLEYRLHNAA